ncbi:SDR family NAD(P)-dependent oxidoreductase [Luteimonas sp. R10]|uniref:SDR family NAD(P)-dependent oxidoreductase n=1 Tax=Luteimonas sp. R10 TaxID=3108176 RepID=UPI00308BB71B|nr:SDR family oxidoreductase [Luteimonas sp. R10]
MMLKNRTAAIYGAGGSLGGAVARAFAREGARLVLSGRRLESVERVAAEVRATGGEAEAARVDALDRNAVDAYVDDVVRRHGALDISFNAIGLEDTQDIALVDMDVEDFVRPIRIAMQSHFITATAAGRLMKTQGGGAILSLTATPGGIGYANVGGFGPACCAIESFSRDLASELGPYGVRVVNIRSAGSPDSRVFREAIEQGGERAVEFIDKMRADTMLKALPSTQDIANAAVFLASDMAAKITGVTLDVTCGTTSALNYKVTPIAFARTPAHPNDAASTASGATADPAAAG